MRFRSGLLAVLTGVLSVALSACRDEPPPPMFAQDLGDENRPLPPPASFALTLPDKVVSGKADLTPLDTDAKDIRPSRSRESSETEDAVAAPPALPPIKLTTTEFPATAAAVQTLIAEYNQTAVKGDIAALGEFYVEDQRPDMVKALTIAKGMVEKVSTLVQLLKEKAPEAAGMYAGHLAMLGTPETALQMQLVSLTPESETRATGTLGPMQGGETVRFRRIEDRWYIDPDAARILADMQANSAKFESLDEIIEGLKSGSMDGPMAVQKIQQWMMSLIGGAGPGRGGEASGTPPPP